MLLDSQSAGKKVRFRSVASIYDILSFQSSGPNVRGNRDHAGMTMGGVEMAEKRLGVVVSAADSSAVLTSIAELEQRGMSAAWLTSAGAGGADPLGAFVGAALRTQHIQLGTAITQTFPRHPIAVVQQVQVLAQL